MLLSTSCNEPEKNHPAHQLAEDPNRFSMYPITSVLNNRVKCVLEVRLAQKLPEDELQALSEYIKKTQSCKSSHLYISYLLPEMTSGNGAWAVVEFDPNYRINHMGLSQEEELKGTQRSAKAIKIVGQWVDNELGGEAGERIRLGPNGELIYEFFDLNHPEQISEGYARLRKVTRNGQIRYVNTDPDNPGEYYVILPNGNLACYDNEGLIAVKQKLP